MQKIDATRKQKAALIGAVVVTIAAAFPVAYPAKNCTTLVYYCTSLVALTLAFTRLKALARAALVLLCVLVVSFLIPLDVALVKSTSFGAAWVRYEAVDSWDYGRDREMVGTNYVGQIDSPQVNGVEPIWILRVYVPWGAQATHGANEIGRANRRLACPRYAGWRFGRASYAQPSVSAAVAHLGR